jgi:hypothetical protein
MKDLMESEGRTTTTTKRLHKIFPITRGTKNKAQWRWPMGQVVRKSLRRRQAS